MKNIAIVSNNLKDIGFISTKEFVKKLLNKANIYMDKALSILGLDVNYVEYEQLFIIADIMVVLGGDGSILQVATPCAKHNIPVLGVNLGRVGFMTETEPNNIDDAINAILTDNYTCESRMLIKMEIVRNGISSSFHALNDVVVSKSAEAKLIKVGLYADDELVNNYIADGLIIATPTGSTGYSISAGGPVVDPSMQLYIATPICPHMLSVRSAILSSQKKIVIRLDNDFRDNEAVVSCDGDVSGFITEADEIVITKSKYEFKMIKIGNYSFFDTLLRKLT